MSPLVTILEPVADAPRTRRALAPRPPALAGHRVGLLDNSQVNASLFMERVGELLLAQCEAASARAWRKPFWTHPAPQSVVEELAAKSDLAVVGWGS